MITKKEIKYIQSLYHKKNRDEENAFIAEGPKIVAEIFSSGYKVLHVYALAQWIEDNPGLNAVLISGPELEKISQLQTPNQVLAIVEKKAPVQYFNLQNKLTLVLDGIQDPGNLGTIIRIADWFGITQIAASADTADVFNSKVIQATMGSFLRVQCRYTDVQALLSAANVPVYGALLNGKDIRKLSPVKEGILVIGNESKGIRSGLLPYIIHPLTITRIGQAESLNAAIATGIILSHICA
ncbi:RNA methyltransferase [Foetidibacter luteolus]|uniref:RNA methyltransferase n=1 Tax=Foetidibacter luteolus TaxID=2608880 RepID=UPI00129BD8E0|nr:RNA methyltransferase [Foetidibacter luteolus]